METIIPKVILEENAVIADNVNMDLSDSELKTLSKYGISNADGSKRGPLGLPLVYLKAIQEYFKNEGRQPTDIELETLAQTWSEHCKHKIFSSNISYTESVETKKKINIEPVQFVSDGENIYMRINQSQFIKSRNYGKYIYFEGKVSAAFSTGGRVATAFAVGLVGGLVGATIFAVASNNDAKVKGVVLETESGKHFDPDLIATTVSIRETIENIFDKQTTHIH